MNRKALISNSWKKMQNLVDKAKSMDSEFCLLGSWRQRSRNFL